MTKFIRSNLHLKKKKFYLFFGMKIYFLFVKESYGQTNSDRKYELAELDKKKKKKNLKKQNDK